MHIPQLQMKVFVEKVNIIVEQELPDGRTYPVVALTMGKYRRMAIEMNVYNWSSEVDTCIMRELCQVYTQ